MTKINSRRIVKPSSKVIDQQFKENRIMNEENVKIAKIKKSCRVGKKVSGVMFIVSLVAAVACFITGVWIFAQGKKFDDMISEAEAAGYISTTDEIGSASMFSVNLGSVPKNIHSDIPAVQAALDDHPMSMTYSAYLGVMSLSILAGAVLFFLVKSIFGTIEKEETPFTAKVKKRVTVALIILSALFLFTAGAGFAAVCVLITWAINAILDYGITLQTQSDETL